LKASIFLPPAASRKRELSQSGRDLVMAVRECEGLVSIARPNCNTCHNFR
jgi:hypothetical protein